MQGGRFGAGDGLRALAALAVVGFHAAVIASTAAAGHASGPVWAVASHLGLGLYVFFVLSGYLIARPFARSLVTGGPGPRLRRYATHRLRRIVPAFWAALLITLAVAGAGGARRAHRVPVRGDMADAAAGVDAGRRDGLLPVAPGRRRARRAVRAATA